MYGQLNTKVPLFEAKSPWTVRASFLLFVIAWFFELNRSLQVMALALQMNPSAKGHLFGFVIIGAIWCGWKLFNLVLMVAIAYGRHWARLIELAITVIGLLIILVMQYGTQRVGLGLYFFTNAAATILLFVPSAAAWFKRR